MTRRAAIPEPGAPERFEVDGQYAHILAACRGSLVEDVRREGPDPALAEYLSRGKMLRALLVYLFGGAVGGAGPALDAGAQAIEQLHAASLIHDDIIDRAASRRGHPALHVQIGLGPAIVCGDFLIARAFASVVRARVAVDDRRVLDALERIAQYAQECCLGEADDVTRTHSPMTEAAYVVTAMRKTGAQFAAAAVLGTLLGGGTAAQVEAADRFGSALGVAYQITDDVLDVVGDPAILGKPVANSMANGRPSLPLIYMGAGVTLAPDTTPGEAREAVREGDVGSQTRLAQERFLDGALTSLDAFPASGEVRAIEALARFCVERAA